MQNRSTYPSHHPITYNAGRGAVSPLLLVSMWLYACVDGPDKDPIEPITYIECSSFDCGQELVLDGDDVDACWYNPPNPLPGGSTPYDYLNFPSLPEQLSPSITCTWDDATYQSVTECWIFYGGAESGFSLCALDQDISCSEFCDVLSEEVCFDSLEVIRADVETALQATCGTSLSPNWGDPQHGYGYTTTVVACETGSSACDDTDAQIDDALLLPLYPDVTWVFVVDPTYSYITVTDPEEDDSTVSVDGRLLVSNSPNAFMAGGVYSADDVTYLTSTYTDLKAGFDVAIDVSTSSWEFTVDDADMDGIWWSGEKTSNSAFTIWTLNPGEDAIGEMYPSTSKWELDLSQSTMAGDVVIHLEGPYYTP